MQKYKRVCVCIRSPACVFAPRCYDIIGWSAALRSAGLVVISSLSAPPPFPPCAVFHMFHLPEPARSRGPVPLHQRQPVLRTRQTHSAHQRPFEFTADEPTIARPEGETPADLRPTFLWSHFKVLRRAAGWWFRSKGQVGESSSSVSCGH